MVRYLVLLPSLLILNIVFYVVPAQSDDSLEAAGLCHKIENIMNALVDYTATKCIPSSEHGAISFILLSEKAIFSIKASKKGWLIVAVAAVGKTMNEHPKIKSSSVYVSDLNLMKDRKGYKYTISLARKLQRQVSSDQIGIEELYRQLDSALVPFSVPLK